MASVKQLQAVARDRVGKGAARAVRRQGRVPAVIYGAGDRADADRPRLQRGPPADLRRALPHHRVRDRGRRREDPRHPARLPARPGEGPAGPCRFPAARRRPEDQGRGAGPLHQPGGLAGPQARRHAQHRAPHDRAAGAGRGHPGCARRRSDRLRYRRFAPHLGDHPAGRREADDQRARLHRRDDRRPVGPEGRGGGGRGGCCCGALRRPSRRRARLRRLRPRRRRRARRFFAIFRWLQRSGLSGRSVSPW